MAEKRSRGIHKDNFSGNVRMQRAQIQRTNEAKEATRMKRAQSLGSGRKRTHDEMVQERAPNVSDLMDAIPGTEEPLNPPIEAGFYDELMMGLSEQELASEQINEATESAVTSSNILSMDEVYDLIMEVLKNFEGFDIIACSKPIVDKQLICSLPHDDKYPLVSCARCCTEMVPSEPSAGREFQGSFSKGSFSRALYTIFQQHGMQTKAQNDIIELLRSSLPYSIRLPTHETKKASRMVVEYGIAEYADYAAPDFLTFDACVQGCCVFVGDYIDLSRCPTCRWPRYTPCDMCQAVEACSHPSRRTANRTLNYRPIIGLLTRLLVRYPDFYSLCNFRNCNIAADSQDYVVDFMQGAVAQKQLAAMDKVYAAAVKAGKIDSSYLKINLLLAQFYDGIQVYSTKTVPFEPLILEILNLPPNLRGVIGIGSFIVSIIALTKISNNCEQFIFRDCMIKELESLSDGIPITCQDGRKYFLQARMVMHCLDTPAMAHLLRLRGKGSYAGCSLCRCFPGTRRADLNKVSLYDHRRLLDYEHVLRFYGQSQKCCPPGFYAVTTVALPDANQKRIWENADYKALTVDFCNDPANVHQFFETWCLKNSSTVAKATVDNVMKFLKTPAGQKRFICYHDEFTTDQFDSLFGDFLFFAHCNYTEQVSYARVHNDQYLREAAERAANNVQHANGVEDIWDFARLRYADLQRHTCWDPFHVLKCIYENFNENLAGERMSEGRKKWCESTGCHPSLWKPVTEKKGKLVYKYAYVLTPEDRNIADACMNCLVFPVGHKRTYAINNPFAHSGNMMGHGKIAILSVFMDYMLRLTDLPIQYKNAFALFSQDISQLLSPIVQKHSVDKLWKKILESIVIMEGFFPESEAMFPRHQLLDLPKQLLEFGPVRGWWTFFGERALSHIKKYIPKGGRAFYKTVFEQYIVNEATRTEKFYNTKTTADAKVAGEEKDAIDDDNVADEREGKEDEDREHAESVLNLKDFDCLSGIDGAYYYNAFGTSFYEAMKPAEASATSYDLVGILDCLIREIERRTTSFKNALHDSPLFNLVHYYGRHVIRYKTSYVIDNFIDWMMNGIEEWVDNNQDKILATRMEDLSEENIYDSFCCGIIFAECLAAGQELFGLNVEMYRKAEILGVLFRARGWECRERMAPTRDENQAYGAQQTKYKPCNEHWNRLKQVWHQKKQYSSWCRIKTWKFAKGKTNVISAKRAESNDIYGKYYQSETFDCKTDAMTLYGQLNAFLVLIVPSDKIVNNMSLASITCRKIKKPDMMKSNKAPKLSGNYAIIDAIDSESFESEVYFVPATHIVPSVVALAGYHVVEDIHKPIKVRVKGGKKDNELMLLNSSDVLIDYLTMVDVDRNSADAVFEYIRLKFGHKHHSVTASGEQGDAIKLQFGNM